MAEVVHLDPELFFETLNDGFADIGACTSSECTRRKSKTGWCSSAPFKIHAVVPESEKVRRTTQLSPSGLKSSISVKPSFLPCFTKDCVLSPRPSSCTDTVLKEALQHTTVPHPGRTTKTDAKSAHDGALARAIRPDHEIHLRSGERDTVRRGRQPTFGAGRTPERTPRRRRS